MESASLISIGNKAQSKSELYKVLVVEVGMYLPPCKETHMLFISQVALNEKKVLFIDRSPLNRYFPGALFTTGVSQKVTESGRSSI